MRTVKKETIDRLLEAVDEFGKALVDESVDGEAEYDKVYERAKIVSKEIFGHSFYGAFNYSLMEFVRSLRIIHPIKYCTNEEIYALLKMLDIEVVEEQKNA